MENPSFYSFDIAYISSLHNFEIKELFYFQVN